MKKTLVVIFMFVVVSLTVQSMLYAQAAEKVYVFIQEKDIGSGPGHSTVGDIIAVLPFTPQYEPTQGELDSYLVLITYAKDSDIEAWTEPDQKDDEGKTTKRYRKRYVDLACAGTVDLVEFSSARFKQCVNVKVPIPD